MGWSLRQWRDANRDDEWSVGLLLSVERGDEEITNCALNEAGGGGGGGERRRPTLYAVVGRIRPAPPTGTWHHITASYDPAGTAVLYVDGMEVANVRPCATPYTTGAYAGGCGGIRYATTAEQLYPSRAPLLTLGGEYNAYDDSVSMHSGLMSTVRIHARALSLSHAQAAYALRSPFLARSPPLSPFYWVAVTGSYPSPDPPKADVDENLQTGFQDRFGQLALEGNISLGSLETTSVAIEETSMELLGRFGTREKFLCRWQLGSVTANSETATVAQWREGGAGVSGSTASDLGDIGDVLRCKIPAWYYGATQDASVVVVQVLADGSEVMLWQRVCVWAKCGYVPPPLRQGYAGGVWWLRLGLRLQSGRAQRFQWDGRPCPPGEHSPRGGVRPWCEPCLAGYISTTEGALACTACPLGSYSPVDGGTACTACPSPSTTSQPGGASLDDCQVLCFAGRYGRIQGAPPCLLCDQGFHAPASGASVCTQCAPGTSTPPPSAQDPADPPTACRTLCPPGTEGPFGLGPCTPCAAGTFSRFAGDPCQACPAGMYSVQGQADCEECPTECEVARLQGGSEREEALRSQCCVLQWPL